MARGAVSKQAADGDTSSAAIIAQQRIFQLKNERDKKINDVVAKTVADLDGVKRQVTQELEQRKRQRRQKKAGILLDIAKTMQSRAGTEEEMMAVVADMHAIMTRAEDRMVEAYDAKEREVQEMLEDENA